MNIKNFLILTLLSSVTMFAAGGIWHEVVMAQFYREAVHASHEGTGIIFIACFILAAMMTWLYIHLDIGKGHLGKGFIFGTFIGLLWVFPHELAMSGAHGEPLLYVFKNATWHMVEQGLGGLVLALVYQKLNK